MMKINKDDVKSVEFVFENCEWMEIPSECFENLDLRVNEFGESTLTCIIKDNGNIDYGDGQYSPIERLCKYNDITKINAKMHNERHELETRLIWKGGENNSYQKHHKINYSMVEISVLRHRKHN